jgi:hypothetical protein
MRALLTSVFAGAVALGCSRLSPVLAAANDALGALCDTRDALGRLKMADAALRRGDVCAARELIQSHLVELGHDQEVAAVLNLIDTQSACKG